MIIFFRQGGMIVFTTGFVAVVRRIQGYVVRTITKTDRSARKGDLIMRF